MINNWTDIVNGIFECAGLFFIVPSIVKTVKSKTTDSVSYVTLAFFTAWSFWNIYFYPSNGLTVSFVGSIFIGIANLVWLVLVVKYSIDAHKFKKNNFAVNHLGKCYKKTEL